MTTEKEIAIHITLIDSATGKKIDSADLVTGIDEPGLIGDIETMIDALIDYNTEETDE